ncbi:MAG TPA: homocysteine S-methyltransferase family protein [Gaiellales bacterium]|nr:homocysteine S-methyltransferase family protein [Gaiellales bacterium]
MAVRAGAYATLQAMIAEQRCVVLDGGLATELQRRRDVPLDERLWGTGSLVREPQAVLDVHRAYARTGCNVISTDTWSILAAPGLEQRSAPGQAGAVHWMDMARLGVTLARQALEETGRVGDCAVAFAISEEADPAHMRGTLELLAHVLEQEPPDLILLETLTLIRDPATYDTIELLLATGLPVWVSFRRCRHGVCGVFGQHWGPPEGDLFGRAARRFEQMGVEALLINCLPVDHVPGMISWLRDFTSLPLGVYPNLGHQAGASWRFDPDTGPEAYAALALQWRSEGAQIIGGCCGVTPEHIAELVKALAGTTPGRSRPAAAEQAPPGGAEQAPPAAWRDRLDRVVYPVPFPQLAVDPGVFAPTTGSFLVWKALFEGSIGAGRRCLDVGCGCGILTVQLALNGAQRVHAIDIDDAAVANTLANAFRNGVADHVTGEALDLYQWEPQERFDLIVASLYQMPVDPYEEPSGHRPLDYWGRTLIDHFIRLLPRLLDDGGVAYLMQLSVVGQAETERRLAQAGFGSRVVDFSFFPFGPQFERNREQIDRVEQLSDAYHLRIATADVMVAYLLEITRA